MITADVESEVESGKAERGPGQHLWPYVLTLSQSAETASIAAWSVIERPFIRQTLPCQVALCASASQCIFTSLRAHTGDTNFENQLLLKLNKAFVK